MLDDPRRKAVAAVGDLSHRASLPLGRASGLSGYPDKAEWSYRFNRRNLPDGLDRSLIRCATITYEQLTVGGMLTGAAHVRRVPATVGQPA
jgi:hypothetical protein